MSKQNLIIIDDEPEILEILKAYLGTECGYDVDTSTNPMDGLACMVEKKYDLLIADVNMPGMSGLELVMRVKASYPDIKILMISGENDPQNIVQAVKIGADDFITKPLDLVDVGTRVTEFLKTDEATQDTARKIEKVFHSFGDYQIYKQIGSGGMGIVYRARQESTGQIVALKVLFPKLIKDKVALQRFLREARVIGELDHPNIVKGIDVGEAEGTYFIAMEYLEGQSLDDIIDEDGPLELEKAFPIIRQLFDALKYIHSKNIIHRDIKPTNIIITSDGTAKLLDLGLTKHIDQNQTVTEPGFVPGTAGFMPPEAIFEDDPLDIRADIYALGGTIYFMLTGELPFEGESFNIFQQQKEVVPSIGELNVDVPVTLEHFFQKMMAIKKEDRFQTPDEMIKEFEVIAAD